RVRYRRLQQTNQDSVDRVAGLIGERQSSAPGIVCGCIRRTQIAKERSTSPRIVSARILLIISLDGAHAAIGESGELHRRYLLRAWVRGWILVRPRVDELAQAGHPCINWPRVYFKHFESHAGQRADIFAARSKLHFLIDDRDEWVNHISANAAVIIEIGKGHSAV